MTAEKRWDSALEFLMANGHIVQTGPDSFDLSPEAHRALSEIIEEHPELYAKIFPDRLN